MVKLTIEKIINLVGNLRDKEESSQRFRDFISGSDILREDLEVWITECLSSSGTNYSRAFQDLVNQIGTLLGFEVKFGIYQGIQGENNYDGLWISDKEKVKIIIESKKSGAYQLDPKQIKKYLDQIEEDDYSSYGLLVIGETDPSPAVSTIKGSEIKFNTRIIPIISLLKLLRIKEENNLKHEEIVNFLIPLDTMNIGELIELIENIIVKRVEDVVENVSEEEYIETKELWTEEKLEKFLKGLESKKQIGFMKALAKKPERARRLGIVKEEITALGENFESFTMAGVLSCLTRRKDRYGENLERLWISKYDQEKNERYYVLKESYREKVKEIFRDQD